MKNLKFIFFFLTITCATSMYADLSDRAKATYYDAKVKAEDASDTIEEKYNDASDRAKATYYDTKVKAKDASDKAEEKYNDASDRAKATYYNTKVKAKDAYQDMVKEKEKN